LDLFTGCPSTLEPWQEYGFQRLASTHLTLLQEKDLAISWLFPLRRCHDPRLEQWFMDRYDAAMERGDFRRRDWLQMGLEREDSPRIRQYLWDLMSDPNRPRMARGTAWGLYFQRLSTDERLALFLEVFQTPHRFPQNAGVGAVQSLLQRSPVALMREVGELVRANAALANQYAFDEIVQASYRYTDLDTRRALADALEDGLAHTPGLTDRQRTRLEGSVRHLRQQDR